MTDDALLAIFTHQTLCGRPSRVKIDRMPDLVATRFGPLDREVSHVALHAIAIVARDGVRALDRAAETLHGDKDSPTYQEPPSVRWHYLLTGFLPGAHLIIDTRSPHPDAVARYTDDLSAEDKRALRGFFAAAANFLLSEAMAVDELLELHVTYESEDTGMADLLDELVHTAITVSRQLLSHADTGSWQALVCAEPAEPVTSTEDEGFVAVISLLVDDPTDGDSIGFGVDEHFDIVEELYRLPRQRARSGPVTITLVGGSGVGKTALVNRYFRDYGPSDTDIEMLVMDLGAGTTEAELLQAHIDAVSTAARPDLVVCEAGEAGPGPAVWPDDYLSGVNVVMSCPPRWQPDWQALLTGAGARVRFIDSGRVDKTGGHPPDHTGKEKIVQLRRAASMATTSRDLLRAAVAATVMTIAGVVTYLVAGADTPATAALQASAAAGALITVGMALRATTNVRKAQDGLADRAGTSVADLIEVTPVICTGDPHSAPYDAYIARVVRDGPAGGPPRVEIDRTRATTAGVALLAKDAVPAFGTGPSTHWLVRR